MPDFKTEPDLETWTLLGASRGLGRAFYKTAKAQFPGVRFHLVARKKSLLEELREQSVGEGHATLIDAMDLSEPFQREVFWSKLFEEVQPSRIFFFAGGGPYGAFHKKGIKDHRWAIETTLLAPMELIHQSLLQPASLRQVVILGSSVAEDQPDPLAASYSCAKHGLKGLITSLWQEMSPEGLDLRLFSPGYMDTDLLPPGAVVRQTDGLVEPPEAVAERLLNWSLDPKADKHYKCDRQQGEFHGRAQS